MAYSERVSLGELEAAVRELAAVCADHQLMIEVVLDAYAGEARPSVEEAAMLLARARADVPERLQRVVNLLKIEMPPLQADGGRAD